MLSRVKQGTRKISLTQCANYGIISVVFGTSPSRLRHKTLTLVYARSSRAVPAMMTSQFRSGRGKTRKREISRDFSRFFDPAFFRSFIDPFCPFRCCVRTRTHEKGLNLIVISLLRAFLARRYSFPS